MKRTLSLILAVLLASTVVSCGKTEPSETNAPETKAPETQAIETNAPATDPVATDAPETAAPAPEYAYDTSLVTENGIAKAHIVLSDTASDNEKTAATELAYHIKLVSGADVTVTNAAQDDSLPIIIATPDSMPELETLFPDDLAWLRTLEEDNGAGDARNWSPYGFAIRAHEGKIYIFGAHGIGAMNGVYDFIEENLDVIWVGATDAGIIYDEMPTINVVKADYREKSPFSISAGSYGATMFRRNKMSNDILRQGQEHNAKSFVMSSPIYDPNITEYWERDSNGITLDPGYSKANGTSAAGESLQINYWSELTADTVAATVLAKLDAASQTRLPDFFSVGPEDEPKPRVYPECTQPFEYAPGQFVQPGDADYLSTVYFSFYNRVARQVKEKYPTVTLNVLTFTWSLLPPRCELEDNISIWFCPYMDDYNIDSYEIALELEQNGYSSPASEFGNALKLWNEKFPKTDVIIYEYYFCNQTQGWYERPLWYKIQNDLQDFAEWGYLGTTSCYMAAEGSTSLYQTPKDFPHTFTHNDGILMNRLSYWLYFKLLWNPYENVDELIVEFCDKVYGEASDEMQEYYRILHEGWDIGSENIQYEFNAHIGWDREPQYYYDYFLDAETEDGVYVLDGLKDALTRAYEAADDRAKEFIRYPYELYQDWTQILN